MPRGKMYPPRMNQSSGPALESLAKVLSDKNRALLAMIAQTHPASLRELAQQTGRADG